MGFNSRVQTDRRRTERRRKVRLPPVQSAGARERPLALL